MTKPDRAHLPYLEPEAAAAGMVLHLLELERGGRPVAPFKASRFTVEPGFATPVDQHAVHEIWIIGQGEGELTYDGVTSPLGRHDVVYFEPHKPHTAANTGGETMTVYSLWWREDGGR